MPINQDQFWGSNAKVCVTWPIHANVAIVIRDFQQKYVVLKAMRRSGGISKDLLIKDWNWKCTFQISQISQISSHIFKLAYKETWYTSF